MRAYDGYATIPLAGASWYVKLYVLVEDDDLLSPEEFRLDHQYIRPTDFPEVQIWPPRNAPRGLGRAAGKRRAAPESQPGRSDGDPNAPPAPQGPAESFFDSDLETSGEEPADGANEAEGGGAGEETPEGVSATSSEASSEESEDVDWARRDDLFDPDAEGGRQSGGEGDGDTTPPARDSGDDGDGEFGPFGDPCDSLGGRRRFGFQFGPVPRERRGSPGAVRGGGWSRDFKRPERGGGWWRPRRGVASGLAPRPGAGVRVGPAPGGTPSCGPGSFLR